MHLRHISNDLESSVPNPQRGVGTLKRPDKYLGSDKETSTAIIYLSSVGTS